MWSISKLAWVASLWAAFNKKTYEYKKIIIIINKKWKLSTLGLLVGFRLSPLVFISFIIDGIKTQTKMLQKNLCLSFCCWHKMRRCRLRRLPWKENTESTTNSRSYFITSSPSHFFVSSLFLVIITWGLLLINYAWIKILVDGFFSVRIK